jgi:hypothetical protein
MNEDLARLAARERARYNAYPTKDYLEGVRNVARPTSVPKSVWGDLDLDTKLEAALKYLGDKWLLHPKHSPKKGDYDPWRKK